VILSPCAPRRYGNTTPDRTGAKVETAQGLSRYGAHLDVRGLT
jgi:hypothetical protein